MPQKNWAPFEVKIAHEMKAEGKSHREIAERLGRSYSSVEYQLRKEFFQARNRSVYRPELRDYAPHHVARITVPDHLWDERDQRANEYRDTTAMLCGDPVPSQSALGKRSAMVSVNTTESRCEANAPISGS